MSLRRDADVVAPYKNFTSYDEERVLPVNYLATAILRKPKTAALFVSGCEEPLRNNTDGIYVWDTPHSTENYLKHINHTLDVYIFSDCGRPLCNSRMDCIEMAAREFYFIFVLESSPCFDHPLELIYDSFAWDIVPVYFGQSSLGDVVPPGSVYDTTPERTSFHIVDKLNILRDNITEYLPYLTWKEVYYPTEVENPLCALCDALYRTPEAHSSHHKDVMEWWDHRQNCGYVYPSPGHPMIVVEYTQDGASVEPDEIADIPGRIRRTPPPPRPPVTTKYCCEYEDSSPKNEENSAGNAVEHPPHEML
ncbi:alpha-(1,3)-fucosyltransferase fut-1-like [Amblyomma americanum]